MQIRGEEESSMTTRDDTDIAQERRLIGLFAEMRCAGKSETTTYGAAKHDIAYLRGRLADNPALTVLLLRLFQPPPVQPTRRPMADHAHGTGEDRHPQ
jgi:hypothetical protein